MIPLFSILNRAPVTAQIAASRRREFGAAAASLKAALAEAAGAEKTHAAETTALAEKERELAELTHPGVEAAAIAIYRDRKATLEIQIEGYRARVAAAAEKARAAGEAIGEAREAFAAAKAKIDAPAIYSAADHPKLKADADKAIATANKARASFERLEHDGEAALAAFDGLAETGADEEAATRILDMRNAARSKIAEARDECESCEETERTTRDRLAAFEQADDHGRRRREFVASLPQLMAQREQVAAALKVGDQHGLRLARLVRTSLVFPNVVENIANRRGYSDGYGHGFGGAHVPPGMAARGFLEDAEVPGFIAASHFVAPGWDRRSYERFEAIDELFAPLRQYKDDGSVAWSAVILAVAASIEREYELAARAYLDFVAVEYAWRQKRDKIFDLAGDAATEEKPNSPATARHHDDRPILKMLSLPSVRNGGTPIWRRDWTVERLFDLTRESAAA